MSLLSRHRLSGNAWIHFGLVLLFANMPDFDFIPGYFTGEPSRFHGAYGHSLGGAILTGLIVSLIFYRKSSAIFFKSFLYIGSIYYSHLILDFFNEDTRFPYGVMLIWPFSDKYFISQESVFMSTPRSMHSHDFFQSMLTMEHLSGLLVQAAYVVPFLIMAILWNYFILGASWSRDK